MNALHHIIFILENYLKRGNDQTYQFPNLNPRNASQFYQSTERNASQLVRNASQFYQSTERLTKLKIFLFLEMKLKSKRGQLEVAKLKSKMQFTFLKNFLSSILIESHSDTFCTLKTYALRITCYRYDKNILSFHRHKNIQTFDRNI